MLCKLCKSNEAIRNSHVVPRFVSNWIKDSSPLGGLRNVNQPNIRREDTDKVPLLCADCEKRFSRWETQFAQRVFHPFNKQGVHEFEYSDWLLRFAVSLSWRMGVIGHEDLQSRNHRMSLYLEEALTVWGNFLQGRIAVTAPYEHHLFFDSMAHCVEFVGAFYNGRYALQTIDCCIPATDSEVGVYVKLPGMVFFSGVSPARPMGWKNTLIQENGLLSDSAQEVTYPLFWRCMQDSVSKVAPSMNSMSEVQKRKLQEQIKTKQPRWKKRPKEKIVKSS